MLEIQSHAGSPKPNEECNKSTVPIIVRMFTYVLNEDTI